MLASRSWIGGGRLGDGPAPQVRLMRALGRNLIDWGSFSELWASLRRPSWWWLTVLPLAYLLLRFVLHFVFDLIGKLLATAIIVVAAVIVVVVRALGWVLGKLLWPVLWLFDVVMRALEAGYPHVIRWSLRNRFIVYSLVLAAGAATVWAAPQLDSELIPELHQGEFTVELSLPVGTPLQTTNEVVVPVEQELLKIVPRLRNLITTIGSERDSAESGERGEHTTRLRVALTSQKTRAVDESGVTRGAPAAPTDPNTAEREALAAVRPLVSRLPDAIVNVARPALFSFTKPIEVEVRGYELAELGAATRAVREALAEIPGCAT
jgi:HAE1 family hydrophobic/amphiphilic exporter-1